MHLVLTTPLPAAVFTQQHIQIEFAHHLNTKWLHVVVPGKNIVRSFCFAYCRPQGWLWMTIIHVGRPLGRISHQIHVASATNRSSSSSRGTTSHKVAWTYAKISLFFFKRSATDAADQSWQGKWEMEMPQLRFHRKGRRRALQRGCSKKKKKGLVQKTFDCPLWGGYSSFFPKNQLPHLNIIANQLTDQGPFAPYLSILPSFVWYMVWYIYKMHTNSKFIQIVGYLKC